MTEWKLRNTNITYREPDGSDIWTEEEQLEECCEVVDPHNPCVKVGKKTVWNGYDLGNEEDQEDWYREVKVRCENDPNCRQVTFVAEDRGGYPCGYENTEWEEGYCCGEGAPAMYWVQTHTEVKPGESYVFEFDGGTPPYTWTTEGAGLYTGAEGKQARVEVTECFCFPGTITVTDNCDVSLAAEVTSEEGYWEAITESEIPSSFRDVVSEPFTPFAGVSKTITGLKTIGGIPYKVEQYYSSSYTNTNTIDEYLDAKITPNPCFVGGADLGEASCDNELLLGMMQCQPPDDPSTYTKYVVPDIYTQEYNEGNYCSSLHDYSLSTFETTKGYFYSIYHRSFKAISVYKAYKWVCPGMAEELIYDDETSPEVINDDSVGLVYWDGGKAPFKVVLGGQGLWADSAKTTTQISTSNRHAYVYTGDACGILHVSITDSCGNTVQGVIRSSSGEWQQVYAAQGGVLGDKMDGTDFVEPYGMCPFTMELPYGSTGVQEHNKDGWQIYQYFTTYCRSGPAFTTYAEALARCESVTPCSHLVTYPGRITGSCYFSQAQCQECAECIGWGYPSPDVTVGKASQIKDTFWYYSFTHYNLVQQTHIDQWVC